MKRTLLIASAGAALGAALAFIGSAALSAERTPAPSPAARGEVLFREMGCVACHGPGATGGLRNPRSKEREVPGFGGGMAMMYIESGSEIREWILEGRPKRLASPLAGDEALLKMPAYKDRLSEAELQDLIAWYRAVAWVYDDVPEQAEAGRKVARRLGCFGCHGVAGQAGVPNPGSFKGYIPGFAGDDYAELVQDDQELKAWILEGVSPRFAGNPLAARFLEQQVVKMPAFKDVLEEGDLDALIAYVHWVRSLASSAGPKESPP